MSSVPSPAVVSAFGLTIFLGAFLLFQIQLVIGKYILPWYGGVPMVWTTCMLVFQVLLLAGYAYAHLLVRRLPERRQRTLHLLVVAASVAVLGALVVRWGVPLLPGAAWKPQGADAPIPHIVALLAVAVGAPYFVVATTSPLIQAWFGARFPGTSPYRFYALSNAGSLLALLTYPTLFEVWLPLRLQAWLWAALFTIFTLGVTACALISRQDHRDDGLKHAPPDVGASVAARLGGAPRSGSAADSAAGENAQRSLPRTGGGDPGRGAPPGRAATDAPTPRDWMLWTTLAAVPSALLLATTNYMSQEVAVVPFLWIVPLSAYLLSFVLTFDSARWYVRGPWALFLALGITLSAFVLERGIYVHVLLQIGVGAFTLFAACMVCHGELARMKPASAHLTAFYLALTVGGALGGAFVSLVAPVVFPGTWEYPLGLWLAAALACVAFYRDRGSPLYTATTRTLAVTTVAAAVVTVYVFRDRLPWTSEISDPWLFGMPAAVAIAGLMSSAWLDRRRRSDPGDDVASRSDSLPALAVALDLLVIAVALGHLTWMPHVGAVEHSRSFYGIVRVESVDPDGERPVVRLRHGRIVHGKQYGAPEQVREPSSYYGRDSGVALALEHHPRRAAGLRIGVVGLGVGTLAAYGRGGDTIRFYELNPDVNRLAGPGAQTFTYVRDSAARVDVVVGDARLALEAELARGVPQRFDLLAIDAFSSDAIPAHLLTREALAVYLSHLAPDGVLAIHITNRFLALEPVVRGLAKHFGLAYVFIPAIDGELTWRNDWALLTRDRALLEATPIKAAASFELSNPPAVAWTDDYSNLLGVLKR